MTGPTERPGLGGEFPDRLVGEILDAVDDPALVCDPTGRVRAWNDRLAERVPAVDADGGETRLDAVVDTDDDPLSRAVETGERTRTAGQIGDQSCAVRCRPVDREGTVAAVVVRCERDPDGTRNGDDGPFDVDARRRDPLADVLDEYVHPADRERVRETVEEAVVGDGELTVEFRLDGDDDRVRWVAAEGEVHDESDDPDRLVGTVRDVTDRKERERELAEREQRLRAVIESSADPIVMQDPDGRYQVVNEAMVETTDRDRGELVGATPRDVLAASVAARLERHRTDVLETERARVVEETLSGPDAEHDVQLTFAPYYGPDGDVRGTVSIARDITDLERQRDELETLTEIQELVQENVRALTAATTRDAIRETVCERLAASPFYELVWIGERSATDGTIEPTCAAGRTDGYLDEITVTVDQSDRGRGPGGEAYRTGRVQIVHDVAEAESFGPWRDAALERGFRSLAAVPLTHGSTTHGVLVVYADRPRAFSMREIAGFETLGDVVGFALSAAQYRRLVEAEAVLDLEFEVSRDGSPFIEASAAHDCRFVIELAAHTGNRRVIDFVTVEGADPSVAEDVAEQIDAVLEITRLDREDGPHFEMLFEESVFTLLADAGARGTRGVVEDGVGHLFVEAPGDADLRRVTEAVEQRFGEVDLVAKREQRRTDPPWWHASDDVGARLTDRQRSVLRTAYYSGYYEWPRETDSESLADSLDIASSTFLQHLRKGHRRVLEAMFDS